MGYGFAEAKVRVLIWVEVTVWVGLRVGFVVMVKVRG